MRLRSVAVLLLLVVSSAAASAGTWSIVPSPNVSVSGTEDNYLNGVTCVSASDCWAVGYDDCTINDVGPLCDLHRTLAEHWDGAAWSIVSTPDPSVRANILYGVDCVTSTDCWAVGYQGQPAFGFPGPWSLALHWDGNAWTIVPTPNPVGQSATLQGGVSCVASNDCWASGYVIETGAPIFEHWDGTLWSLTMPPVDASLAYFPQGMTCVSSTECVVVGQSRDASFDQSTLVFAWDGHAWTQAASPDPSPTLSVLSSVSCASASDCWAVGRQSVAGRLETLAIHWDGASWSVGASQDRASQINELDAVVCNAANDCWATGDSEATFGSTLTEHWDGAAWSIAPSAITASRAFHHLTSVTCATPAICWAVGHYAPFQSSDRTLIERSGP